MPESTLSLSYDEIRKRVADHRGYGLDPDEWDAEQIEFIDFCLRDGSRTFYTQSGHEWSFLTPTATLTIDSGATEVELPWDFGFITDDIYFSDNSGCVLKIRSDGEVYLRRQHDSTSTGRPTIAAAVPNDKPLINHGETKKLIFWPTAGEAYTIRVIYSIMPNALGPQAPYPYGGAAHAQTILEACLAASERLYGVPGLHNTLYLAALEQSKMHDRRLKPRTMGYNPNGPRMPRRWRGWQPRQEVPVVYTDL
jgi:hypothetical protein